ncbi:hypothetical protein PHYSODRAFT_506613 [Phytophthora sojae]|uniref:Uncharacterized protein n=1 Tax=Phytophthora sojae (strain P6497) TaxID=1094619 RepID=G4ZLN4_PHYSP|nr:hypothetical protein PHYSODRAFT_506613 [Phytophthora sojae]EGZ14609.1 hypothetical protein PHYSODRAFT_506613 [Phytophthora sojae]|eukprot:XP_009528358.1 hypothetical protein PHYSODRAFT_506613 [Phytophthora sojae]
MDNAATNGHLEIVKWLHWNTRAGCLRDAMNMAAGRGALNIVKILHEYRAEGCTEEAPVKAGLHGHLHVVKWFHVHRPGDCGALLVSKVASTNNFEVFLFLVHQRCEKPNALEFDNPEM